MTIQAYIAVLNCHKSILEENRPFELAVLSVNAERSERIFTNGEKSDGSKIGKYNSTTPLYVNPLKAPRSFATGGKNEFAESVNIQTRKRKRQRIQEKKEGRKTRFFPSYEDYRREIGRESSFVNLNLFGILKSNYENRNVVKNSNDEYVFGLRDDSAKIMEGHEKKYGKISDHTEKEIQLFHEINEKELHLALSKCE